MSEHTPGPWRITRRIPEQAEENDYLGAEISWREATGHDHKAAVQIWSERIEGDAALIAAAPDLLTAVRGLVNHPGPCPKSHKECAVGRAAIAKAEGK